MLRALLRNKLGLVLPDLDEDDDVEADSADARDSVRRSEDALTATAFERLLFLPPTTCAALLAPEDVDEVAAFGHDYPTAAHFWPSHRLRGRRVEPDVVLEFADRVVVIEVKWGSRHYSAQWRREILAAAEHYRDSRALHLVLVGRSYEKRAVLAALPATLRDLRQTTGRVVYGGWLSWERLFWNVTAAVQQPRPAWERAVLVDLRDALADRGLRTSDELHTLTGRAIRTSAADMQVTWGALSHLTTGRGSDFRQLGPSHIETSASMLLASWRP